MRTSTFTNKTGKHLLLLLAFAGVLHLAMPFEFETSSSFLHKASNGSIEKIDCYQSAIVPSSENTIAVSSCKVQYTSEEEDTNRLCASFFNHHRCIVSQFAQYMHVLQTIGLNYRKADRLFPSHYFW